jgi:UDP-3-O-acyl N-acetylglucosamine deacetylase
MANLAQRTIKREVSVSGVGLQTGDRVNMRFVPAPPDSGVRFLRTDLSVEIPASVRYVASSDREIVLENNGARIRTVEHLLAALCGLSICNLIIEIDGDEPPILDGSSLCFVELIKYAGIEEQGCLQKVLKVEEQIGIEGDGRFVKAVPDEVLRIVYTIFFDHPLIKEQSASFVIDEEVFIKEIAPARTFGFLDEVDSLRAKGLAQGGSLENAIVIGKDRIMNTEPLRFSDELVRHKILDLLGDIFLLGFSLKAQIIAYCSGHSMNIRLAKRIAEKGRREGF